MCIIVIQPEGYEMSPEQILDFVDRNPHGFGFMWMDEDNRLRSVKAVYDDPEDAVDAYYQHAAGKAGVLHYRFATSGPVNEDMTHPFEISKDLLMVHNGVLPGGNSRESDTAQFVREVLKPLLGQDYTRLYDRRVKEHLSEMIKGSALVFLDRDGVTTVLGSKGLEWDGCWYSNMYAWTLPEELGGPGLDAAFDFDEDSGEYPLWSEDPDVVSAFLFSEEEEKRDRRRR